MSSIPEPPKKKNKNDSMQKIAKAKNAGDMVQV
jgi:hypothetical protein